MARSLGAAAAGGELSPQPAAGNPLPDGALAASSSLSAPSDLAGAAEIADAVAALAGAEASEAPTLRSEAEQIAEARIKGYEGEACGECGNFTLVRNGTCLKCDTCGGTSGCS